MAICCPQGRDTLRQKLFSSHYVVSKLSHSSTKAVSKFSQRSPKKCFKNVSKFYQSCVMFIWVNSQRGDVQTTEIASSIAPTRVLMVQSTTCQTSLTSPKLFSTRIAFTAATRRELVTMLETIGALSLFVCSASRLLGNIVLYIQRTSTGIIQSSQDENIHDNTSKVGSSRFSIKGTKEPLAIICKCKKNYPFLSPVSIKRG